jgi:hypothetical protein
MDWTPVSPLDLAPDDPKPGVSVEAQGNFWTMGFFARGRTGLMVNASLSYAYSLGGTLASAPAAIGSMLGTGRMDVAALIDDHGRPGVWWKFFDWAYKAPCNYNQPGTCAQCGCNLPGTMGCDL